MSECQTEKNSDTFRCIEKLEGLKGKLNHFSNACVWALSDQEKVNLDGQLEKKKKKGLLCVLL